VEGAEEEEEKKGEVMADQSQPMGPGPLFCCCCCCCC